MNRRSFFRLGLAGAVFGLVHPLRSTAKETESDITITTDPQIIDQPVVISTWEHGLAANKAAWEVLKSNGSALDAVEAGVKVTEADVTNRSVGIGGRPDRTGHVTLDACIMDHESRCGSVGCLEGIAHPISVARSIMDKTQHVMLVGDGARAFALSEGFAQIKTPIDEVKRDWKTWKKEERELAKRPEINHENHDTIGMLALDSAGNLSGACTTSGWAYKMPGRLGDSPIIGAGLFVDNEVGAACATGLGEAIIRIAGSHTVVELMRQGKSPEDACRLAVERIIAKHKDLSGLQCGFIALNKKGEFGGYSVYNGFNFALKTAEKDHLVDAKFNRNW